MRDTIKPDGLRKNIASCEEAIPYGIEKINGQQDQRIKNGLKSMLMDTYLQKKIAHYSVGDDKDTIKKSLLEMIPAFKVGWDYNNDGDYVDAIWIVSMAILCDIDLDDFKKITAHIKSENLNDSLLTKMIQYKQSDWQGSSVTPKFGVPYTRVLELDSTSKIKTYLDKNWYKEHGDISWVDLHKSRANNYFGYWAWEVAVIAKINGIDDSSLEKQKYYPYDAVHW